MVLVVGLVRWWNAEEGWGVIDSPESPGGCFAHYSCIQMDGYRQLTAGQRVWSEPIEGGQDGCAYRTHFVSLDGTDRETPQPEPRSEAYRSVFEIRYDEDPQDRG